MYKIKKSLVKFWFFLRRKPIKRKRAYKYLDELDFQSGEYLVIRTQPRHNSYAYLDPVCEKRTTNFKHALDYCSFLNNESETFQTFFLDDGKLSAIDNGSKVFTIFLFENGMLFNVDDKGNKIIKPEPEKKIANIMKMMKLDNFLC